MDYHCIKRLNIEVEPKCATSFLLSLVLRVLIGQGSDV